MNSPFATGTPSEKRDAATMPVFVSEPVALPKRPFMPPDATMTASA